MKRNPLIPRDLKKYTPKQLEDFAFDLFDVTTSPAQEKAVIQAQQDLRPEKVSPCAVTILECCQAILLAKLLELRDE